MGMGFHATAFLSRCFPPHSRTAAALGSGGCSPQNPQDHSPPLSLSSSARQTGFALSSMNRLGAAGAYGEGERDEDARHGRVGGVPARCGRR